ncbi:HAMP domain-containing sensor histidine kinase, partial [Daejeonella sp.]|uniref:sensor histidine kinase n=1 Tax=Daejeonella sp. TaxID=2805397 RepID=UPI0030C07EB7
ANTELIYQNEEKEKRAAELAIANTELIYQNEEKEKRAAELAIANNELVYQNDEKEKRAAELAIANKELVYQNGEKEKRAAELAIANIELIYQSEEKEKRAAELLIINEEIALHAQLKELNQKKDEFIALAGHELRSPLTSLSAYLQFLQRNLSNDEKNKQLADKALTSVDKLQALVSDLLDVSKIEAGQLSMTFGEFNIVELVEEVVEMMHYSHLGHKIVTKFSALDLIVDADKQRIEQVMINLISNAIKYSPKADQIVVAVSEKDNDIQFCVQDFGMGIKEKDQSEIFSRFYRVEELAAFIAGLGIGLYISQDIIIRHNSIISVDSKYGTGSTFSFKLPKVLQ